VTGVHVFGIRHHGPGSARAVAAGLDEVRPDVVVIEGAPELDAVAALAGQATMAPPVAGLVYAPEQPRRATFYPLSVFSPEWVALRWSLEHGVPVRFADLPAANMLADRGEADAGPGREGDHARDDGDDAEDHPVVTDPIGVLARAAGFDDPERWWEDAVEHRHHGLDAFDAVRDAMAELRTEGRLPGPRRADEARREAAMRLAVRAAAKDHGRVVFVCGAWHAPAVHPDAHPPARHDQDLLRGLPKIKVAATWVPWTNRRLAYASGYGAGVASPGWYEHLFTAPGDVTTRWLARTARLLREEQYDTSTAAVIEGVRLADALATLRGRPLAGLSELTDATQAVLCGGSTMPLDLIATKLFVGDALGAVPDSTPMVPLARDLERLQRRLRLKPTAAEQLVTLDLRTDSHRERSHLLHRLLLLDVPWGAQVDPGGTRGTFKEAWRLAWEPELAVALIDASGYGTTIGAATAAVVGQRVEEADIAQLTGLVEQTLLADLPEALATVMEALADRAARQHDTERLMAAVEPLARVSRYGNVRKVDTEAVLGVLHGIAVRVCVGLGPACSSLDDEAAERVRSLVDGVQRGLALVDDDELRSAWNGALAGVADQHGVHGAVSGRAVRLLLDGGRIDTGDAGRRLSRALSRGADAVQGAAWLDGFLSGDASLLLHDEGLLSVIDAWVAGVGTELFDDLLPLLRRTFSAFQAPERRMLGQKLRRLDGSGTVPRADPTAGEELDPERAARVAPLLRRILGVE
jgi:hypothetical protein